MYHSVLSAIVADFKSSSQRFVLQLQKNFVLRVMSCSRRRGTERGLAIITPRVALIRISQGDGVRRETNTECETQRGIKRETKAQEEARDWKREFKIGKRQKGVGGGDESYGTARLRDTVLENSL